VHRTAELQQWVESAESSNSELVAVLNEERDLLMAHRASTGAVVTEAEHRWHRSEQLLHDSCLHIQETEQQHQGLYAKYMRSCQQLAEAEAEASRERERARQAQEILHTELLAVEHVVDEARQERCDLHARIREQRATNEMLEEVVKTERQKGSELGECLRAHGEMKGKFTAERERRRDAEALLRERTAAMVRTDQEISVKSIRALESEVVKCRDDLADERTRNRSLERRVTLLLAQLEAADGRLEDLREELRRASQVRNSEIDEASRRGLREASNLAASSQEQAVQQVAAMRLELDQRVQAQRSEFVLELEAQRMEEQRAFEDQTPRSLPQDIDRIRVLQRELTAAENHKRELLSRVQTSEASQRRLESELQAARSTVTDLEAQAAGLEWQSSENSTQAQRIRDLERQLAQKAGAEERIRDLERQLAQKEAPEERSDDSQLRLRIEALQEECSRLEQQLGQERTGWSQTRGRLEEERARERAAWAEERRELELRIEDHRLELVEVQKQRLQERREIEQQMIKLVQEQHQAEDGGETRTVVTRRSHHHKEKSHHTGQREEKTHRARATTVEVDKAEHGTPHMLRKTLPGPVSGRSKMLSPEFSRVAGSDDGGGISLSYSPSLGATPVGR